MACFKRKIIISLNSTSRYFLFGLFIYLKDATKKIEFGQYDDDYDEDYDNEKCSPEHNLPKEFVSECFNAESFWLHVGSCKCAET